MVAMFVRLVSDTITGRPGSSVTPNESAPAAAFLYGMSAASIFHQYSRRYHVKVSLFGFAGMLRDATEVSHLQGTYVVTKRWLYSQHRPFLSRDRLVPPPLFLQYPRQDSNSPNTRRYYTFSRVNCFELRSATSLSSFVFS